MEKELFVFDMIDFLPEPILSLLFKESTELVIKDALRLTDAAEEKEVDINILLSDLLIGKIALDDFENSICDVLGDKKNSLLIYEYIYQKLLKNLSEHLNQSRQIYIKQLQEKQPPQKQFSNIHCSENTDLASYIKSQAEQIKKKSLPQEETIHSEIKGDNLLSPNTNSSNTENVSFKTPAENLPYSSKKELVIPETNVKPISNISAEASEEVPAEVFSHKTHLASLLDKQKRGEVKISEYYKNLKNTMNNDLNMEDQKTNIFQPPFKSKKRGALIETSFEKPFGENPLSLNNNKDESAIQSDVLKAPVKYSSVTINPSLKPDSTNISDIETDDKFIDLGGTF